MSKKTWIMVRIILLILLATILFYTTEEKPKSEKLSEYSRIIKHTEVGDIRNNTYYELPQEEYQVRLNNVEDMLKMLLEINKIDTICFVDEGSRLGEHEEFRESNLTIGINYSGREEIVNVVDFAGRSLIDNGGKKCFKIEDPKKITWNWWFYIGMNVNFQEMEYNKGYTILSPNVQTYITKVPNVRYYFFKASLSIIFAGIFLWALTRIWKYIMNPLK